MWYSFLGGDSMLEEQIFDYEVDEFIRQLQENGTYVTVDELKLVLRDFSAIMKDIRTMVY